jgi:hypothetical protein
VANAKPKEILLEVELKAEDFIVDVSSQPKYTLGENFKIKPTLIIKVVHVHYRNFEKHGKMKERKREREFTYGLIGRITIINHFLNCLCDVLLMFLI